MSGREFTGNGAQSKRKRSTYAVRRNELEQYYDEFYGSEKQQQSADEFAARFGQHNNSYTALLRELYDRMNNKLAQYTVIEQLSHNIQSIIQYNNDILHLPKSLLSPSNKKSASLLLDLSNGSRKSIKSNKPAKYSKTVGYANDDEIDEPVNDTDDHIFQPTYKNRNKRINKLHTSKFDIEQPNAEKIEFDSAEKLNNIARINVKRTRSNTSTTHEATAKYDNIDSGKENDTSTVDDDITITDTDNEKSDKKPMKRQRTQPNDDTVATARINNYTSKSSGLVHHRTAPLLSSERTEWTDIQIRTLFDELYKIEQQERNGNIVIRNKWSIILSNNMEIYPNRTTTDLKDKWRLIQKAKEREAAGKGRGTGTYSSKYAKYEHNAQ